MGSGVSGTRGPDVGRAGALGTAWAGKIGMSVRYSEGKVRAD